MNDLEVRQYGPTTILQNGKREQFARGVGSAEARRTGDAGADAILAVEVNGGRARFAADVKSRAPYPGELHGMAAKRRTLAPQGVPLLVVPFVSESTGAALADAGWSWGDEHGNFDLRAAGLVVRQRRTSSPPGRRRRTMPRGSGSYAVIRALMGLHADDDVSVGATSLASQAMVSQPRASQVLRQVHSLGLVESAGRGRWLPRREDLLDRFLTEYPGPGGSEQYFYSLDPLAGMPPVPNAVKSAGDSTAADVDVAKSPVQNSERVAGPPARHVLPDLFSPPSSSTTAIGTSSRNGSSPDAEQVPEVGVLQLVLAVDVEGPAVTHGEPGGARPALDLAISRALTAASKSSHRWRTPGSACRSGRAGC